MPGTYVDTLNQGHNNLLTEDVLYGLDGNDQLLSSEATVYAEGGRGNDFLGLLVNVNGTVELYGGQGNDQAFGRSGALDKLYGGDGDDWLVAAAANLNNDGSITPAETSGVDLMFGESGSDALYGFDNNDELYGGSGDDKGTINVAKDTTYQTGLLQPIKAGLFGGDGSDQVFGGSGSDLVSGGAGADFLDGGTGADEFRFDAALGAGNIDRIADFSRAEGDTIGLTATVFSGLGASVAKNEFVEGGRAKDGNDHLLYNEKSGKLFYDADGKGGEGKVLFAQFDKGTDLNHTDFLMV